LTNNTFANLFLASLSAEDYESLRPHLQAVDLPSRKYLHEKDQPIDYIYFADSGMISLIIPLEDGGLVEAGIVGQEGAVGLTTLSGGITAPHSAMVQMPGKGLRISPAPMRDRMMQSPQLARQVLQSVQALSVQLSYTAVCNVRHTLPERLARWLLMAHDRAEGDELPLTHEFMGMMLGVRRSGVTIAANTLQRADAIGYGRGRVKIRDRHLLEEATCECYRAMAEISRSLLNWPPPRSTTTPRVHEPCKAGDRRASS
jgi:CRP-like cAMP-binding protein